MSPSDWRTVKIDDIKAPTRSALAMGPFGSNIKSDFFVPDGVPVVRGNNLNAERFEDSGFVFLTERKADELLSANAFPDDIVFTHRGTLGQVGIIPKNAKYDRYVVSQSQMKLTCNKEIVDPYFVFYLFRSPIGQHRLLQNTSTTGVPAISQPLTSLRNIDLFLPPLPEQHAIARILGSLDDKIELNRKTNATLEAMAQALFKSWFVDFDPVREKMEGREPAGMDAKTAALFPDALEVVNGREVPEGWDIAPMSKIIEVNPRISLRKGDLAPYLDMKNMPTQGHRAIEWVERPFGSGIKFANGDTLLARITPCLENGKTAYVDFLKAGQVGWGSTEYIVFRPKPPLPKEYGYYLARSENLRDYAIQNMTGTSGRQRVAASCFDSYLIVVPSPEVARPFEKIVKPLMTLIKRKDEESRTLAALRDTLLPKLISGEIRVPVNAVHQNTGDEINAEP